MLAEITAEAIAGWDVYPGEVLEVHYDAQTQSIGNWALRSLDEFVAEWDDPEFREAPDYEAWIAIVHNDGVMLVRHEKPTT